jgi:hypothetical protein
VDIRVSTFVRISCPNTNRTLRHAENRCSGQKPWPLQREIRDQDLHAQFQREGKSGSKLARTLKMRKNALRNPQSISSKESGKRGFCPGFSIGQSS